MAGTNLELHFEFTLGYSGFGVSSFYPDCFYSLIANEEAFSLSVKHFLSPYFVLSALDLWKKQGYLNTCGLIYDQCSMRTYYG